ncbi:MAG: esterase/lipase family protein [Planctomycetota bacterium]|jgi:pimeloyl-ACP methyl ester carboxylesterase
MRLLTLLLLLLGACASGDAVREGKVRRSYRKDAGYPATGLPPSTRAVLDRNGWSKLGYDEASAMLEAKAAAEPDLRLELAEFHFLAGGAAGTMHTARNAWSWMSQAEPKSGPKWERAMRLYNAAVRSYVLTGAPAPKEYAGVLDAREIPVRGFRHRVERPGLGMPLVAVREQSDEREELEPYWPPLDVGIGLTAVLRFDGPRPNLQLHDPMVEDSVSAFGATVPLAADFTAPLAYLYEQTDTREWENRSLRNPSFNDAGFVLVEPVRRDKIPVVFFHGLKANPADFRWMVNELRADPEVRSRYQFIGYRYPSSLPLPVLGLDLRENMATFWQWFDKRAPGARKKGYVILGHSLGGLLAKTLAVRSGDEIYNAVFRVPKAEVAFTGELGRQMSDALFLEPDPQLARLIFLAVPHRGSAWAEGGTAEAALNAIQTPEELRKARREIERRWGTQLRPEVRRRLFNKTTSIQSLRTDDPYLLALAELPITVPFDSVIGNLLGASVKPTTDGIVSYRSAHLDGASSETVVRSAHNVHHTKHGIAAVRDILKRAGR